MSRILIEIGHPAHVHQFKHMYWDLLNKGWEGLFVSKDKECSIALLNFYKLPYRVIGKTRKGMAKKVLSLPIFAVRMLVIALKFRPDIFVSRVSPLSGYASFILRKPHITFTDTENVKLLDSISEPFADVVLTSTAYLRDHGAKHIRYHGFHELAYLHPTRFTPNKSVLEKLNLNEDEPYALVRFVSWNAHHDLGHKGMRLDNKLILVQELVKHLKVFISSEGELPPALEQYRIRISPEDIHDVLFYARIFVGESATMASESAILGTPALYLNSQHFGCTDEQATYGLLELFPESQPGQECLIQRAIDIASDDGYKNSIQDKKASLLRDNIDVTAFMVWFIDNHPESLTKILNGSLDWDSFR